MHTHVVYIRAALSLIPQSALSQFTGGVFGSRGARMPSQDYSPPQNPLQILLQTLDLL